MTCHACGADAKPYAQAEIKSSGIVQVWRCPACQTVVPQPDPQEQPEAPAKVAAGSPATGPAKRAPSQEPSPGQPLDILKAARARRRWLTMQLRQAKAWQRELDSLTRLLDAASTKAPRAPKG